MIKTYWFGKTVFSNKIFSKEFTFEQLVSKLEVARPIDITREEYQKLSRKETLKLKDGFYVMAAGYKEGTTKRQVGNAEQINLIAIDIDDSIDARRILEQDFAEIEYSFVIFHTTSSTEDNPRLRLIMDVKPFAVEMYGDVVQMTAGMFGIHKVSKESLTPIQPMLFPKTFKEGNTDDK